MRPIHEPQLYYLLLELPLERLVLPPTLPDEREELLPVLKLERLLLEERAGVLYERLLLVRLLLLL